jgi:signal transduction histidine kinase
VEKTEDIIDDSISEIRNVAHNLMPKGLSTKGLISTLRDYFEELGNLYGKAINFSHSIQSIVDPELQLHIYRIICELVLNAARHSTATRIAVSIKSNSQLISADVEDNGEGFTGIEPRKSFGLEGVRSRVEYLGGRVQINSPAGEGVAIHFEIPLQSHEAKVQSF